MNDVVSQMQTLLAEGAPGAALALAREQFARCLGDPAFVVLWAALELDHDDAAQAHNLSIQLVRQGISQAVRVRHVEIPAWLPQSAFILGECAARQQRWSDALAAYAVACFLDPGCVSLVLRRCAGWPADEAARHALSHYAVSDADVVLVTGGLTTSLADVPPWMLFDGATLATTPLGGSESAFVEISRAWAAEGHRVVAFTPCLRAAHCDGVTYRPNVEYFLAVALAGAQRVIVARNEWYLRAVPAVARRWFWVHDAPDVGQYVDWRWTAEQCAHVVCVSAQHATQWQRHFSLPDGVAQSITNGFSPQYFETAPTAVRAPQLVYCSRPERGLDVALAAFAELRCAVPALTLHVATYDPTGAARGAAEQYHAAACDGVVWHAGLSKSALAQLLQSSQALFYPNTSTAETSCMAAIEAMAAGCPVICSDRGALSETVVDGVGGVIVPYTADHSQLAHDLVAATLSLLRDPSKWTALSLSARARAHTHYCWSDVARRWWAQLV